MSDEFLESPISVVNDLDEIKTLKFSPDEIFYSDVDGVPVATFSGKSARGTVRFDLDPPRYTSINERDGIGISREEFLRLVHATRAEP